MLSRALSVAIAFVLLVAPQGIEPGIPETGIIQLVVQGGVAGILVWIWWKTHTQANEEQAKMRQTIGEAFEATRQNSREVARKNHKHHEEVRNQVMAQQREMHKTQKQLVGVMTRLEAKLDRMDE